MTDINNDEDVKTLVHSFYAKVVEDDRLGYVFNDFAQVDWDKHLPNMIDFWSNLVFHTGRYKGRPFRQHLPLPIEKEDFNIWYSLWVATVNEHFKGERATFVKEMAGRIASSFTIRLQMEGKFD